jgi:hypothetical protein
MPSIAIYGDRGMGKKTMIMEKFHRDHPPLFDGEAGDVFMRPLRRPQQFSATLMQSRLSIASILLRGLVPLASVHLGRLESADDRTCSDHRGVWTSRRLGPTAS